MYLITPNRALLSGSLMGLETRTMSLEIVNFVVGVMCFLGPSGVSLFPEVKFFSELFWWWDMLRGIRCALVGLENGNSVWCLPSCLSVRILRWGEGPVCETLFPSLSGKSSAETALIILTVRAGFLLDSGQGTCIAVLGGQSRIQTGHWGF